MCLPVRTPHAAFIRIIQAHIVYAQNERTAGWTLGNFIPIAARCHTCTLAHKHTHTYVRISVYKYIYYGVVYTCNKFIEPFDCCIHFVCVCVQIDVVWCRGTLFCA